VAEEAFDYLDAPPSRVTAPHTPVPYSRALEDTYMPNESRVVNTVQQLLGRS
jgi:pyruvate/2-oxoglutarate/acetoin dehydrogenase E1 component